MCARALYLDKLIYNLICKQTFVVLHNVTCEMTYIKGLEPGEVMCISAPALPHMKCARGRPIRLPAEQCVITVLRSICLFYFFLKHQFSVA